MMDTGMWMRRALRCNAAAVPSFFPPPDKSIFRANSFFNRYRLSPDELGRDLRYAIWNAPICEVK